MFAFGVWERLLDAPKPRGCKRPALSIVVPTVALALFASACDSDSTRSPSGESTAETRSMVASPLRVVAAPTPRFPVPRYDTSGTYPQVRGDLDLRAVNVGLRKAVRADQREYAPSARRSIRVKNGYRGIYQTAIDWRLLSASTVVVSALLPAIKLHPGGNEGRTWVPATVRVPSGALVGITDLFAHPSRALRVLAKAWKAQVRRTKPKMWPCVSQFPEDYAPRAHNYRYFALTIRGLAVGFWQAPACDRLQATVRYSHVRPYLSKLGERLVAGVRRPRGGLSMSADAST